MSNDHSASTRGDVLSDVLSGCLREVISMSCKEYSVQGGTV